MIKDSREIDTFIPDAQRALAIQDKFMRHLMKHLCKDEEFYFIPGIDDERSLSTIEQLLKQLQLLGVDVLYSSRFTARPGNAECKCDWHQPNNLCLETVSNTTTNPPRPGWMRTNESKRLLYSFVWLEDILDTFDYDFKQLRDWFWKEDPKRTDKEWRYHTVPNSRNHTLSRLVPIQHTIGHVTVRRYLTTASGKVLPVSPASSLVDIKEICKIQGLSFKVLDNERESA